MRLVSFRDNAGARLAAEVDGQLLDLQTGDASLPSCMKELLALGDDGLARASSAIANATAVDRSGVKILPPIPAPEKVICIGLNYADHAAESGAEIPNEPVVFNKFPSAIRGHQDDIVLPEASQQVDYEAELVVIIGRTGRDIPQGEAMDYVAGYACGHDVSARDWQLKKPGGQWLMGKTFDSFAPYGPALVTADEIDDPGALRIALRLNGETMQDSTTRQLIFPIDQLVSYLSTVCTLKPGDIIFTGTPPGVGMARKPPVFLKPGDVVEIEIEAVGTLSNPVVAADR